MATTAASSPVPPMPFVVASWLGYPLERIVAGLQRGSIAPPAGAPPGWLPPGAASPDADPGDDADPAMPGAPQDGRPAVDDDVGAPADAAGAMPTEAGDLRTTYRALVRAIDPTAADEVFDALWRSGGDDESARAASVGDLLWRTVTGAPAPASIEAGDAAALAAAIEAHGTHGTLAPLAAEGSEALAQRARTDPATLGALAAGDAFAFAGTDGIARWRFDPATGEALVSDAWIDDRARYVAWRQALADDPAAAREVDGSWRFVDRTLGDGATIALGDAGAGANQVVFAREEGDRVTGGAAVDRIHGGSGDDVLRGAAGDDFLEGAHGDDFVSGGSGRDSVDGGAGDDELVGGSGDDALDGRSGDDVLEGGRGDDTMRGGTGHDVYEFARGDGNDVVVDADGDGAIVLDGRQLTGDDADEVGYVAHDDGAGGTTLVVRTGEDDGPAGEIRIRDWQQGLFGIRLDDATEVAQRAPTTEASVDGARLKPLLSDDAHVSYDAQEAADAAGREPGTESGSGTPLRERGSPVSAVDARQDAWGQGALELADWTRATSARRLPMDDAVQTSPDVDPAGVTAADFASALAGAAGDHDESEAGGLRRMPAIWDAGDDWASAIVPPDVPARPLR